MGVWRHVQQQEREKIVVVIIIIMCTATRTPPISSDLVIGWAGGRAGRQLQSKPAVFFRLSGCEKGLTLMLVIGSNHGRLSNVEAECGGSDCHYSYLVRDGTCA